MKSIKKINLIGLCCLLVLALFNPTLSHAQCDAIAVVFETTICQADISLPNRNTAANPLPPEKLAEIEKLRLFHKIRSIAAEHLLAKGSYTPSDEEVDRYVAFMEKADANRERQTQEIVSTIEHLLNTYQYTESNKKRLEDGLATFRRSVEQDKRMKESDRLRDEAMRKQGGEAAVKDLYARFKQSRRRIGMQWVASWKMNKALYKKYGGRVIFQQAGIEPIDAYRAQLKDIREKGALKILQPAYGDVFSEFERDLDMGHNYLSDDGDKYFDRPYWETADLNESHQRNIDEFKAIPHK